MKFNFFGIKIKINPNSKAKFWLIWVIFCWFFLLLSFIFSADPYVKVWLMFGEKRVEKKKTPIYKCNLNPIFNASFEFDVPWEQIRDCAIDVQVMDFDTIGRNELIGKILLACKFISFWHQTKKGENLCDAKASKHEIARK